MKVIICGAGQVGASIATQLASEENHIIVIDQSADLIHQISETLDVKAVTGFASHPNVLEEAGAEDADMIIAVTYSDEVNMVACQVAHSLFDVPFKIARVRQQSYLQPIWKELFQSGHLPIDVIISPEIEAAKVIRERLKVPGAIDMASFADGAIQMIAVRCMLDSTIRGGKLYKVQQHLLPLNTSVMGLIRNGEFIIAEAEEEILFNDELYLIADSKNVFEVMKVLGESEDQVKRALIIGGGNIGLCLAETIETEMPNISLKVIEINKERAESIAEKLTNSTVLYGSALDHTLLEEAGILNTEMVIAVSNDDKVNILSSLLAKRFGCQRAITLLNNTAAYRPLVSSLGIDMVVSPRESTVSSILRHIRMGKIRSVRTICDGKIEIMEAEALEASPAVGARIGDLNLPEDIVLHSLLRQGEVMIPTEDTMIHVGDRIVLLCTAAMVKRVEKIFSVKFEYF